MIRFLDYYPTMEPRHPHHRIESREKQATPQEVLERPIWIPGAPEVMQRLAKPSDGRQWLHKALREAGFGCLMISLSVAALVTGCGLGLMLLLLLAFAC